MRGISCDGCVMSVLLGPMAETFEPEEQTALAALADQGLLPPLRLVTSLSLAAERGNGNSVVPQLPGFETFADAEDVV